MKKKESEKELNITEDSLTKEKQTEEQVQAIKTSDFMKETIKKRPINKRKLFRKLITTVVLAVLFGLVACLTFLFLEPLISEKLNPQKEEELATITFPGEIQEETNPQDMIFDESQLLPSPSESATPVMEEHTTGEQVTTRREYGSDDYLSISSVVSDMTRRISPSLVKVVGISQETDWLNNQVNNESTISGVIVADNGRDYLILANLNKLSDADSIEIVFDDDNTYIGEVLIKDHISGYAIVAVNKSTMRISTINSIEVIEMGSSAGKYLNGMPIVALGRPLGVDDSMMIGTITSCSLEIDLADSNYHLLTTDIYGSPQGTGILVNIMGQLMGMIDMDYALHDMPNNICAIGITEMKRLIERMSNGNPIAYLGIHGANVTDEISMDMDIPKGIYIKELEIDSPLLEAGIQSGDIITEVAGAVVETFQDVNNIRLTMSPGDIIKIKVKRQGLDGYSVMEFNITIPGQE